MNVLAPVSTIMAKDLKTVSPGDSLLIVRDLFEAHNIHHIPVVQFKEIIGMISKTDYLYFQHGCFGEKGYQEKENHRLKKWTAEDIMTNKLAKLDIGDPIRTAIDLFRLNRFHALPIIQNKQLVGILTPHDIIRTLADEKIPLKNYQTAKS